MKEIKLTYQQRFYLTIIGVIVVSLIAYSVSIKPTIGLKNQKKVLESNLEKVENAPNRILKIQHDVLILDSLIGRSFDEKAFQSLIIDYFSNIDKKNLSIFKLHDLHQVEQGDYLVMNQIIELEGTFNKLLKAINAFESEIKSMKIISADFHTFDDRENKKERLIVKLVIQSYKKDENEI